MKKNKIKTLELVKIRIGKLDDYSGIKGGTIIMRPFPAPVASDEPDCDDVDENTISGSNQDTCPSQNWSCQCVFGGG